MPKSKIQKSFIVDLDKKEIKLSPKAGIKNYAVKEFYSYLMDAFDEPEYMQYDLPIEAISKSEFKLINGWSISNEVKKQLKGKLIY